MAIGMNNGIIYSLPNGSKDDQFLDSFNFLIWNINP